MLTRYVKVAHDWLPTRHHLSKIDPELDDHCPLCHRLREDSEHVMRCNADIAQNARAIGLSKLRKEWQGQRTPHALQDVFESGLIQWCRLQDTGKAIQCPQTKPDQYGNLLQIAFTEQTSIGWDNTWKGRISKRWGEAVAQHYRQCEYGEIYNAKRWTQSTVKQLYLWLELQWKTRNEGLYGVNTTEQAAKRQEILTSAVHETYLAAEATLQGPRQKLIQA